MNAQLFIIGQIHSLGRPLKSRKLRLCYAGFFDDGTKHAVPLQIAANSGGPKEVLLCPCVGEIVVVHKAGIFVRACDAIDAESPLPIIMPGIQPQAGRFHQHLRPLLRHKGQIARGMVIADEGMGHIPVDVILGRSGWKIGRALRPRDGAPGI
ncbi:hypothetical protein SDC9_97766 [bioreactor metagenome]|uniref:Uncharacterized protein n=1 Tax=bioreactor metagenome TaxID=1076179 RepID=A0A645ACY6_9ZZZZ